jgi:hypothetical protein
MTDKQKQYIAAEEQFIKMTGMKVGSKVRIICGAKDYQYGWKNVWDEEMHDYVNNGKDYDVKGLDNKTGYGINLGNFQFPFYCLEVIDNSRIKISEDYSAIINEDGSVSVGCQNIAYLDLKAVYEAATKHYKPVVKPLLKKAKAPAKPRDRKSSYEAFL